jgi:hypothetical protein
MGSWKRSTSRPEAHPPPRRLRPDPVEQAVAEQNAKRFAREAQDKLGSQ